MKASGLKPPMKIERPCSSTQPRPAIPPSPPKTSMNHYGDRLRFFISKLYAMEHLWETHGRRLSEAGLRRGSDNSVVLTEDTDSFIIGDRVWVGGTKPGQIAYIGETQFAPGDWAGIVLDEPIGKNDGSVAGCRYFQCEPKRGIFSRLTRLTRYPLSGVDCPYGGSRTTSPQESKRASLNKAISPSLNTSTTSLASVSLKEQLRIGERVIISSSQGSKTGVLRFLGGTEFASGDWCGVELDEPLGKNDGTVEGKRYFECRPKYGLFAPVHKVSRSPSNKNKTCLVHRPTGAALNASLKRSGSKESLASISSIGSTATSISRTISASRRTSLRTATPARKSLQEILKDKQQEVEVLKKERDLERDRMTKAASQADRAEQSLQALKQEYEKYRNEHEKAVQEARNTVATLLEEKNQLNLQLEEERRKCEDLLFRFEEESINKDDIQKLNSESNVVNTLNESRVKELEQQLAEERERVIQLEKDSTKLFEAEEELARLRTELQVLTSQGKNDLQEIQDQHKNLEEAKSLLQKELSEKNSVLQKYVQQINELQESLSKKCEESSAHKQQELSHQRTVEETKKLLDEKCALFDILQKEHEIECENWQKELRHLQENMERLEKQKEEEHNNLIQEFQKKIQEKDELVKQEVEKFKTENIKNASSHTEVVKELKNENDKKIRLVTENFEAQLKANDETIQKLREQLNEKMVDCENMVKQLTETQSIHKAKDEHERETLKQIEELKQKIELFGERCSLLLNEEDAVQSEIENELRKFYNEYANINGHQLDAASQAALNTNKETIHVKQLTDIEPEKFQLLKENVRLRYMSNLKLIKDIIAIIVRKDQRIETLEKNITELKNIAMNKDGEIKILFDRTTEMQDALSLSEETKSNLESELRMHETNLEDMKRKLQRAEEKIAVYVDEKHKSELDAANAISTSDDLSAQLKKYNEDLHQKEKELDEARDKEFQLSKSLESVNAKLNKTEEELKRAVSSIQQLETDKKQLAFELESANKNLAQLTSEFKTKETQINATIESMSKKISELDQMIKTANSTIESLRNENQLKEQEIENNKKEIEKLSSECLNRDQRFENINAEANNLRENLRAKDSEIQKLQAELDKKKKDLQQLSNDVKNKSEELEKVFNEKHSLGESQANLLKELEMAKESIKQKESEIVELNSSVKATAEGSGSLQNEIRSLHDKLRAEQEQRDMLLKEKANVQEIEKATRSELSSLKQVLQEKDELMKKMENTMQEISISKEKVFADMKKSTEDEMREKEEMMKKHVALKKELEGKVAAAEQLAESRAAEINELKKRIEGLETNVQLEKDKSMEELKRKGESVEMITAEREKLQQEKNSLEKLVKNYEDKLNTLVENVKMKDVESEKIAQSFVDKINSLNEQNVRIKDGQVALEKENKQLLSRLNEVTENLKLAQENMKNNSNGKAISTQPNVQITDNDDFKNSDALAQMKSLKEENESSKMQINFLNSVIVDMQHKNEKLECKIQVLEMGIPANEADDYSRTTIDKMSVPPRMFCDICDQFDLHETEDCHRQDQDSFEDQQKPPKGDKKIPAPRPYCENCEEFGHDTRDCNDVETF